MVIKYERVFSMIRPPLRRTRLRAGAPLRKRRKTRKGQVPEAVLDALFAQVIKLRDQHRCRYFGTRESGASCQCAHAISRTYRNTRWDEDNAFTLSAKAHHLFHRNPILAGRWFVAQIGREQYDWLWAKAQQVAKVDRHAVKARLMARIKELEGLR